MERDKRFLIRLIPRTELRDPVKFLRTVAKNLGISAVNPKITSYGAVELDLFSRNTENVALFETIISPIFNVEFLRNLNVQEGFMEDEEALARAVELFNSERFWEAHEVLEQVWRRKEGVEKNLVQGLILVCAAYVHLQKKEFQTSKNIIRRALSLLEGYSMQSYYGIDINSLKSKLRDELSNENIHVIKIKMMNSSKLG